MDMEGMKLLNEKELEEIRKNAGIGLPYNTTTFVYAMEDRIKLLEHIKAQDAIINDLLEDKGRPHLTQLLLDRSDEGMVMVLNEVIRYVKDREVVCSHQRNTMDGIIGYISDMIRDITIDKKVKTNSG